MIFTIVGTTFGLVMGTGPEVKEMMPMPAKIWNVFINSLFWTFFAVSSLILVIIGAVIRVVTAPLDPNRRVLQKFSCFWASLYIWLNPFWLAVIKGLENVDRRKAYVMISNHQSMADILIVFRTFLHFKWVAKRSLFKVPLLGWNMWLNGYVPIERSDATSRDQCLDACRAWLKKGSSIFFFPEGTRSPDGQMKPFKVGAFRLALQSGADILPIIIRGSRNAIPKHSRLLNGKSRMSLEVLPPIPLTGFDGTRLEEESKRLAVYVFQKMQDAF
ncbi:MAG: 1-acyl-sn-glycerol-3-phosphate acyltransferase [Acidobacteria bacterium]|nr:1-acyl-sn-glycerol-3-phosphate acyltransferase [Acidobacteriota bacterium]